MMEETTEISAEEWMRRYQQVISFRINPSEQVERMEDGVIYHLVALAPSKELAIWWMQDHEQRLTEAGDLYQHKVWTLRSRGSHVEVWRSRYSRQNIDKFWQMRAPKGSEIERARRIAGEMTEAINAARGAQEMIDYWEAHPKIGDMYGIWPTVEDARRLIPLYQAAAEDWHSKLNAITVACGLPPVELVYWKDLIVPRKGKEA